MFRSAVFSLGESPFADLSAPEALTAVRRGKRLPRPALASERLFALVLLPCWNLDPSYRPQFSELCELLAEASAEGSTAPLDQSFLPGAVTLPDYHELNIAFDSSGSVPVNAHLDANGYVDEAAARRASLGVAAHLPGTVADHGSLTTETRI